MMDGHHSGVLWTEVVKYVVHNKVFSGISLTVFSEQAMKDQSKP